MINVILLERIERLGQLGQVVKVRPGYARNFLLPKSKALRATPANLELFEKQRAELEAKNAAQRGEAETVAKKLDGKTFVIIRQASETGQLFGSVAARDIAEAATEAGFTVARSQAQVDAPIKTLGLFKIKIKLHPEVTSVVTINIARTQEEAAVQLQKGAALVKAEKEAAEAASEKASVEAIGTPANDDAEAKPAKAKKAKAAKAEAAEGEEEAKPKKAKAKKAE